MILGNAHSMFVLLFLPSSEFFLLYLSQQIQARWSDDYKIIKNGQFKEKLAGGEPVRHFTYLSADINKAPSLKAQIIQYAELFLLLLAVCYPSLVGTFRKKVPAQNPDPKKNN